MEPMNCTAYVHHKGADIWVPTQSQEIARRTVARLTGKPPETIDIHTTFLGGGFGRRSEQDFVTQAVQIALYTGRPVKLIWTREDDMQHDFYRPATWNRLHAGLDAKGRPVAWRHRIVGPSIFARVFPGALEKAKGIDHSSVEGAANLRYRIPNLHVDWVHHEPGVPVGFWRSVGNSQNAFVTESFIDELAHAAGKDPYEYRRALLAGAPRLRHVLELAAVKARWDRAPPKGRHRGIAAVESFGSFVAQVAEVSVTDDGKVRVHRVVCAVDCGRVVNPDTVEAQMQSGIVYGLTAALHGAVTVRDGQVEQRNFPDYPMLRIHEMPEVEVHIVSSREAPGGVGEPGTPPIAPAVCNAIYAATGTRIRRLPIAPVEPAQRASKPSTGGTEAGRTGPTPR